MFNIFTFYDELLGIRQEDDYEEVDTVLITREIPEELMDGFNTLVDNWLTSKGYDPLDFECEYDE